MTGKQLVAYYERQLPRKENYSKRTLAYLCKKEKELAHDAEGVRKLLARGGEFADDWVSKALVAMYEEHRQAVLRTIEAKTGKTA